MATQFQTRLVGTIIFVAVGVIFFPEVLDGDKKKKEPLFASIPLQPSNNEKKPLMPVPSALKQTADNKTSEDLVEKKAPKVTKTETRKQAPQKAKQANKNLAQTKAKETVITKTKFTDSAWLIQMGYFNNAANALALKNKLKKAGYQVHSEPKKPINGQLTRVFIGPALSKEKLENQLSTLYKLTKVKGKVLPFKPLEPGAK